MESLLSDLTSFLFDPMWTFLFLMGFAHQALQKMILAGLHKFNEPFHDAVITDRTDGAILFNILVIWGITLILPIILSAFGLLARIGFTSWSWWLILGCVVSVLLWTAGDQIITEYCNTDTSE